MKIGLPAWLAVAVIGVGFAQTPAQALAVPSKPHVSSAVTHATFWHKHEKTKKHVHKAHKKPAHAHKYAKKKH